MGPLQLYEVQVNGYTTHMRLNEADAERLGGVPVDEPPQTLATAAEATAPVRKRRVSRNKARTPTNKSGG